MCSESGRIKHGHFDPSQLMFWYIHDLQINLLYCLLTPDIQ